jgi:RNA polymerase sigma factor for flagellar operon FliA
MVNADLWEQFWKNRNERARERLIEANMNLVEQVLRSFKGVRPADREDLRSSGYIGLIKAVDSWDPTRMPWDRFCRLKIKYAMVDQIREMSWVPKGLRAEAERIEEAEDALAAELSRMPTTEELAERLESNPDELETTLTSIRATDWNVASLDWRQETETPWSESVADDNALLPEREAILVERSAMLRGLVGRLPTKEARVIRGLYFEGRRAVDIAEEMGVHPSRISQHESSALAKLKALAHQQPLRLSGAEVA